MKSYIVREVVHYCNISVNRCTYIPKQKIDFYDFTFVLSGAMTYIVNGETFNMKKNDAIFLRPGTTRMRRLGTQPCKYVSFNFYAFENVEFPFDNFMENCISEDIQKLVSLFHHSHLSKRYHASQKLANMLNYILFELFDFVALRTNSLHVNKIIRYVEENMTEKISLSTVSEMLNLSKEYTAYIFKKEMKKTLIDYINERKMLAAREMILNGEMSLADIASSLGFENYNYFSRLFKKYFDITPVSLKKSKI